MMRRVKIEAALSALFAFMCVVTAIVPGWIEAVSGIDPDHGSGALEWAIVAVLGVIAIGLAARARVDVRRRLQAA